MIPFWPDPSWYATYWYGKHRPRRRYLQSVARELRALLRRAIPRRLVVATHPLIERNVR